MVVQDSFNPAVHSVHRPICCSAATHHAGKDLDSLLNEVDKGYINLQPRYQRGYVWSKEKASRLVESVFLKLFIPAVVLHNGSDGVRAMNWCLP